MLATFLVMSWAFAQVTEAAYKSCVTPRGNVFQACAPDWAVSDAQLKQVSVYTEVECARECMYHPDCESVNVQLDPFSSGVRECQLLPHGISCDELDKMTGYKYYKKIPHVCVTKSPNVRAATFLGNDTYLLFFDGIMQEFKLTDHSMYPVSCAMKLTDYFISWPGLIEAVFYSDVLVVVQPLYVIHDKKVEQYLMTETKGYPSTFPPWPRTTSDLLGAGVIDNVTAVFSDGHKLYTCTKTNLYTSELMENGTEVIGVNGGLTSPEFRWSDVTAAALDTAKEFVTLFAGNSYFLYNMTSQVVVGRGTVCTNV